MSKSAETSAGLIQLLDDPDMIARKFKRAVTDSENDVRYDPVNKPGVSNLLEILGAATGQAPADLAKGYTQYGPLKADAADAVIELLTPIQARYRELLADRGELAALLRKGAAKARAVASATLQRAYDAVGFLRSRWPDPTLGGAPPSGRVRETDAPTAHRECTDRRIIALALPALGSLAVEPLYVLVDTAIVGRLGTAQLGGLALAATVLGARRRRLQLPDLRHDRAGRPPPRRRRARSTPPTSACRRCGCRRSSASCSPRSSSLAAPAVARAARRPRRRPRLRRHVPAHRRRSACRSSCSPSAPRACSGARATTARRSSSCSRRTSLNAVLEVLFVFGFDWGVPGSAWSTVIAQVGAGVAFAVVVRRHLAAARDRRPSRAGMAPLLTAGRHLLLRVGSMLAVTAGATAIAARVDEPTLAAHQIGASLLLFLALALDALAIPAQTLVAEELGQGSVADGRRDRPTAACACRSSPAPALAVVLAALAPVLPHAFTGDPAVVERATAVVLWLAVLLVPAAVAFAYDGVLIGAGDYRFLGLAALAYLVAVAPLGAARRSPATAASAGSGAGWRCGWCCGQCATTCARRACSHRRRR